MTGSIESQPTSRFPSSRRGPVPVRTFLTVRETAFLLQQSEMTVRRLIDAGQLRCLGEWETAASRQPRRLSPDAVRERFPNDRAYELRRLALDAILAGRLSVPAPVRRWGAPSPLEHVSNALDDTLDAFQKSSMQQLIEHPSK